MKDAPSQSVHAPRQARSAQTLTRVLDACDVLLAERSFEQISMQDIARQAGVSVGNLYNRFADRDALIEHIIERHQREFRDYMEATLLSQDDGLSLKTRIAVIADTFHAGLANLRPVFTTLVIRRLKENLPSQVSREETDAIIALAVKWLVRSSDEISGDESTRARFAVASLAFNLQFNLLLGTASRMFGDDYLAQLKHQAYAYLTQSGDK